MKIINIYIYSKKKYEIIIYIIFYVMKYVNMKYNIYICIFGIIVIIYDFYCMNEVVL